MRRLWETGARCCSKHVQRCDGDALPARKHPGRTARVLLATFVLTVVSHASAAGWSALPSMASARQQHSATLLADGRVLVVGGTTSPGGTVLSSSEVYDPAANRWTPAAGTGTARVSHSANRLADGTVLVAGGFNSNDNVAVAQRYHPATNVWSPAGSLLTTRSSHTATLLADGRILVAGGIHANGVWLASAELYDPTTNTWTTTGSMASPRSDHAATLLPSGKVLVAGGYNGGYPLNAEVYDPASGLWTSAASMANGWQFPTLTLLATGKVLLTGGRNATGTWNESSVYDPALKTWSPAVAMPEYRYGHEAALLPDGRVLVSGGWNGTGVVGSVSLYDPASNAWSTGAAMGSARMLHTSTLLANGKLLVTGGYSGSAAISGAELWDPAAGAWTGAGNLATGRQRAAGVLLETGELMVSGGFDTTGNALDVVERFDPATGNWSPAAGLTTARHGHAATMLANGRVLVTGGSNNAANPTAGALVDTELYYPAGDLWNPAAGLAQARYGHTATLLADGTVLAVGGTAGGALIASAERYDPGRDAWLPAGALGTARQLHTATLLPGGKVLVVGGLGAAGALASTALFDPVSGTWAAAKSLTNARYLHAAVLLPNGKVLVAGGYNGSNLASGELYDPATDTWSVVGALATARNSHVLQILPDGRVLAIGGGDPAVAAVERFDVVTNLWASAGTLTEARSFHVVVLTADGKVVVAGGRQNATTLATTERYDTGLAPASARKPTLVAVNVAAAGVALTATGIGFRPTPGGGSGDQRDSATNMPVFHVQRVDGGQFRFFLSDEAITVTDGSFVSRSDALTGFPAGPILVRPWVNGVPGTAQVARVAAVPAGLATPTATGGAVATISLQAPTYDGGAAITTLTALANPGGAQAACSMPCNQIVFYGLSAGSYSFTVAATNVAGAGAQSAPSNTVQIGGAQASVVLQSSLATAVYGQSVTLIATVGGGAGMPTGAVAFRVAGGAPLLNCAGVPLLGGVATCTTSVLPVGTSTVIEADYSGSGVYASAVGTTSVGVGKAGTLVLLDAPFPGLVYLGQHAGLSATVGAIAPGSGFPSGIVTITDGSASCSYVLPGQSACSLTPSTSGLKTLTASYTGDANYLGSSSNIQTLTVVPPITTTGLGLSINSPRFGHTATLLPNSIVLIVGGYSRDAVTNGIVRADPLQLTYTALQAGPEALAHPRTGHSATMLANGKILVAGGNNSSGYVAAAELYDPVSRAWTSAGNLITPRVSHTATLLPSGKVLVAGGAPAAGDATATAELYDPATNAWTPAQPMVTARAEHTATLLPSGKLLVGGGTSADGVSSLASAELYDPATGTWSVAGSLGTPRRLHAAILLANGKVLAAGGCNGACTSLASTEIYDPQANAWTVAGSMKTDRQYFTLTLLPGGLVLALGGSNPSGLLSSGEYFDPNFNSWTQSGGLKSRRRMHTATWLANGQLLIAFGQYSALSGAGPGDFELFDPKLAGSASAASMTFARYAHSATLLPSGRVLVVGGRYGGSATPTAELFDPVAGTWFAAPNMANSRSYQTATLLSDGTVLAAGGYGYCGFGCADGPLASVERYDPAANIWSAAQPLASARLLHTATLLANGKVLVVGGTSSGLNPPAGTIAAAELFDPVTGTWSATGTLAVPRYFHRATLLPSGKVLVTGGVGAAGTAITSAELYDPTTNGWSAVAPMLIAREEHSATLLPDGKVLVAGGSDVNNVELTSTEMYDPGANLWISWKSLLSARSGHDAVLLTDGAVAILGGYVDANTTIRSVDTFERYDPTTQEISPAGQLAQPRIQYQATAMLLDGRVLTAGGYGNGTAVPWAALFDPGIAPDPTRRPQLIAVSQTLTPATALVAAGSGLRSTLGGTSGNAPDSPAAWPVFQVQRIDNGQMQFAPGDGAIAMSNSSFTSHSNAFTGFPQGPVLVRPWVNGVPGVARVATFRAPTLDADGNRSYNALTDGLLILRQLFGLAGTALTNGALGAGATVTDPAQVAVNIAGLRTAFDVDGNGQTDALTDGLLIVRYLFGLRGASLISGAIGSGASRTTAPPIEAYLMTLLP